MGIRGATVETVECELLPPGAAQKVGDQRWRCDDGELRFALRVPAGRFPQGWVLVRARVRRRGGDCSCTLFIDSGNADDEHRAVAIPVPRSGKIAELVRLPDDVRGLVWQLTGASGEVSVGQLTLTAVGVLERTRCMLKRVVPLLVRLPAELRRRRGLTVWRVLSDLAEAYRIAGQIGGGLPSLTYAQWIERFDSLSEGDRGAIRGSIERFGSYPRFHVVVPAVGADRRPVDATLRSLDFQLYRGFHRDGAGRGWVCRWRLRSGCRLEGTGDRLAGDPCGPHPCRTRRNGGRTGGTLAVSVCGRCAGRNPAGGACALLDRLGVGRSSGSGADLCRRRYGGRGGAAQYAPVQARLVTRTPALHGLHRPGGRGSRR